MSKDKKSVSAASVIEIVLIVILVLVMAVMLSFNFLFKKDNTASSLFGMSFYNTKAMNMIPDFPKNTVVIAKASEIPKIKENSVILCTIGEHTTLIRVVQVQQEEDNTYYVVKFDTAPANETFRIESDAVIAKAVWQINGLGSFLEFATSTVGIIIAVVIPLMFIIAIQVARILGIRRLEEEAASLDDISDFMQIREEEEPSPLTFTEPKFVEDITGKIPAVHSREQEREPEPAKEKVLAFDNRGRAEYTERKADTKEANKESPLFTYDKLTGDSARQAASRDDVYLNRPTKIEAQTPKTDELFEKYASKGKGEPVVFTPHMSNIIPDSIAAVQEETAAVKKTNFDDSVKSYYEKAAPKAEEKIFVPTAEERPAIPENAVIPKETIAPPKKQKNNKALEELMSIIDSEESKLKR